MASVHLRARVSGYAHIRIYMSRAFVGIGMSALGFFEQLIFFSQCPYHAAWCAAGEHMPVVTLRGGGSKERMRECV